MYTRVTVVISACLVNILLIFSNPRWNSVTFMNFEIDYVPTVCMLHDVVSCLFGALDRFLNSQTNSLSVLLGKFNEHYFGFRSSPYTFCFYLFLVCLSYAVCKYWVRHWTCTTERTSFVR